MKQLLFHTAAALALLAGPALAQTAAPVELDTAVVTANRTPVPADRVGAQVTVLDQQTIQAEQTPILSDLLARTPGVSVSRNGGVGALTQLRIRGAETDQTVVLIDGVKLNNPASTGGGYNFANLLVQGQLLIALISDPFGRHWNLFGTAGFEPDIGIIDARLTWYVAIGAIVTGHVISVWLAHRIALREYGSPRQAVIASLPLTVLMVLYTAISLSVIAEPLVQFRDIDGTAVVAPAR